MELKINKTVIEIGEKEKALLRATAQEGEVGIKHRAELAQALSAAWKSGVLEPDMLGDIFTRIPLAPGAEAKFPLDFYSPNKQGWFKAFIMPKEGGIPSAQIEGDEIYVPTYKIANVIEWSLDYARDARWDIIARAMEVFTNGFVRRLNDDGWHVLLATAATNSVQTDSAASAGVFTRRLLLNMLAAIKRLTGGRNSKLTDLYISPEGINDLRALTALSIDDLSLRNLLISPEDQIPSFYGVRFHELQDLGASQEYETFLTTTLVNPLAHTGSDEEFCVGLDLQNRDSFVMPVREDLQVFDDPSLHRKASAGVYGWMNVGFGSLDVRRALLGSF